MYRDLDSQEMLDEAKRLTVNLIRLSRIAKEFASEFDILSNVIKDLVDELANPNGKELYTPEEINEQICAAINAANKPILFECASLAEAMSFIQQHIAPCSIDSWVGSPGDFSPPTCNCEKCISLGRGWRFSSFEIKPSPQMWKYFRDILSKESGFKEHKWGWEYTNPKKAVISLYKQGTMSISSNKEDIRIGVYIWNHTEKAWRPVK